MSQFNHQQYSFGDGNIGQHSVAGQQQDPDPPLSCWQTSDNHQMPGQDSDCQSFLGQTLSLQDQDLVDIAKGDDFNSFLTSLCQGENTNGLDILNQTAESFWISQTNTESTLLSSNNDIKDGYEQYKDQSSFLWQDTRIIPLRNDNTFGLSPSPASSDFEDTAELDGTPPWRSDESTCSSTYSSGNTLLYPENISYPGVAPHTSWPPNYPGNPCNTRITDVSIHSPTEEASDFIDPRTTMNSGMVAAEGHFLQLQENSSHNTMFTKDNPNSYQGFSNPSLSEPQLVPGKTWQETSKSPSLNLGRNSCYNVSPTEETLTKDSHNERQPGKHRNPRIRFPDGEEKIQHMRRLANIRAKDNNQKKRRNNLTAEKRELAEEEKQRKLIQMCQTLEAMKLYNERIYHQYIEQGGTTPHQ